MALDMPAAITIASILGTISVGILKIVPSRTQATNGKYVPIAECKLMEKHRDEQHKELVVQYKEFVVQHKELVMQLQKHTDKLDRLLETVRSEKEK